MAMTKLLTALGALAITAGLAACERRTDARGNTEVVLSERSVERGTARAGRTIESAGRTIANAAENASDEASEEVRGVGGGPTTMAFDDALGRMSDALCARERRCATARAGRDHGRGEACQARVRGELSDDLNRSECPAGIDQTELAECLEELRNEDCANPFDTLGRIAACRTSDLCRNVR